MHDIKYLQESVNVELIIGENLCSFFILYRSPSQTLDNFQKCYEKFELNLDEINKEKTFLTVGLGDFNAKSRNRFKNDKTTYERSKLMF